MFRGLVWERSMVVSTPLFSVWQEELDPPILKRAEEVFGEIERKRQRECGG